MDHTRPFAALIVLGCCFAGFSERSDQDTATPQVPMSEVGRHLRSLPSADDLQKDYLELRTDYDRRNFIAELPALFSERNVTKPPRWVESAVVQGLNSPDPLLATACADVAGRLGLNCAPELMELYRTAPTRFGCHEELIKTSVLRSLGLMRAPGNVAFFYEVLDAKSVLPVLSSEFEELLGSIEIARAGNPKSTLLIEKLERRSATLDTLVQKLQAEKYPGYKLKRAEQMSRRIHGLLARLTNDQNGSGQGGTDE